METKKIGAIIATLAIVLSAFGFAFAHWTDTLVIEGTINTGTLIGELTWEVWLPNENDKTDLGYQEVATVECEGSDTDDDSYIDTLDFKLHNVYPSLNVLVIIDVHCRGTIPIALTGFEEDVSGMNGIIMTRQGQGWYSPDGATPEQIDPCQTLYYYWLFHVEQETAQDSEGEFTVTIELTNWNEADPLDLGDPTCPPDVTEYYLACTSTPT
jgi:hypothetical protein